LVFSLLYIVLMIALLSNSGLLLGSAAVVQMLYQLWYSRRRKWVWISAAVITVSLAVSCQIEFRLFDPLIDSWNTLADYGQTIMGSHDNGFLNRLGSGGILAEDIAYLKEHPFSPVGAGVREGWTYVDMGLMDYLLRGSVFLVVFAYGGLFYFLKRNLRSTTVVYMLFGTFVFFELAFSTLTYFRMLYLLPFIVMYLNGLRQQSTVGVDPHSAVQA
jgi:hypothetical protein